MGGLSRRTIIKAGAAAASMLPVGLAPNESPAQEPPRTPARSGAPSAPHFGSRAQSTTCLFLNDEEVAFIQAAVARLIPADDQWPGAVEAGVPNYIDKQLSGAWGAGERLYRGGPWKPGTPSQGYQLPFTPAELFRTAIAAISSEFRDHTPFNDEDIAAVAAYFQQLRGSPEASAEAKD